MMMGLLNHICLLLLLVCASSTYAVTTSQDITFGEACAGLIRNNQTLIAAFVRLSFHDCVSGCDGCINTGLTESEHGDRVNAGLEGTIAALDNTYREHGLSSISSRADFYAKCGQVAAEEGRQRGGQRSEPSDLPISMRYGRQDCNGSPRERSEDFPNPRLGLDHVLGWCERTFSFNPRECVAIMGAHTLGRARRDASGYNRPWVRNEFGLDNAYFVDLRRRNWRQGNEARGAGNTGSSARWQYNAGRMMMLNTDVCLFKDISPDQYGSAELQLGNVADSSTADIVEEYSNDNAGWLRDFGNAFTKMIGNGYGENELSAVEPDTEAAPSPQGGNGGEENGQGGTGQGGNGQGGRGQGGNGRGGRGGGGQGRPGGNGGRGRG